MKILLKEYTIVFMAAFLAMSLVSCDEISAKHAIDSIVKTVVDDEQILANNDNSIQNSESVDLNVEKPLISETTGENVESSQSDDTNHVSSNAPAYGQMQEMQRMQQLLMMNSMQMMNSMASMIHPMRMNAQMQNMPINMMTQPQMLNSMMQSMNPNLMFSMFGQTSAKHQAGEVPDQLPVITIPGFPTQSYKNWPVNTVSPEVSNEAKKNAFQTVMAFSPLSMRDMVGIMTDKIPVAEDITWEDAVDAMKLRANEVNFKYTGSSQLWKEIEAITEQATTKVEIFRFCDAAVARKILDEVPEFIVFLPCRIALIEDAEGKLWVMTLDWDVNWLNFSQNPNSHFSKELRADAERIRKNMRYIMEGAATGEF